MTENAPTAERLSIRFDVPDPRAAAQVKFSVGSKPILEMVADADTLADLIEGLAQARALLADEVPQAPEPKARMKALRVTHWAPV